MSTSDWRRVPIQVTDNPEILLERIDKAFGLFSQEARKTRCVLAAKRNPSSSSYHDLLRQRTTEVVAYEQHRKVQDELFRLIDPPAQL
jgi:hypothetical protein